MSLHEDLTRVIEDARDHSRKDFNVVKESYGQYLARVVLASGVIAKVQAEALREFAHSIPGDVHDARDVADLARGVADHIEKEAGL